MSNFDEYLAMEAAERGWTPDQVAAYKEYEAQVADVESNQNPHARQTGGGPGRGLFQVELAKGGSGSNKSYVTRMNKLMGKFGKRALPASDKAELSRPDPDFSRLSVDTQRVLFLSTQVFGSTPLDDVVNGTLDWDEAWADNHWKGSEKLREKKLAQYQRHTGYKPKRGTGQALNAKYTP